MLSLLRIRKILLQTLVVCYAVATAGCAATDENKDQESAGVITATVSIPPQQWLLEQICGERVKVNCLLHSGADPENYEPSIRQLAELTQSDVYFTLGGLPFEQALIERASQNMPDLKIVDCTPGIRLLTDHCHGHSSSEREHDHAHNDAFDPHLWTSLRNCRIMAANMSRELSTIDSVYASTYSARLSRLDTILQAADDSIERILAPCSDRTFMAWHPSLGYFAADYGLHQLSVQQEDKEVTVRQLAEAIEVARKEHPTVVFYEASQQGRETELLRKDLDTPAVPLCLMQEEFVKELIKAAQAIRSLQNR